MWTRLAWHRRHALAEAACGDRRALRRWAWACASLGGWIGSAAAMAALLAAGLGWTGPGALAWGLAGLAIIAGTFPRGLASEVREMIFERLARDAEYMGRCHERDSQFQAIDQAREIAGCVDPVPKDRRSGRGRL